MGGIDQGGLKHVCDMRECIHGTLLMLTLQYRLLNISNSRQKVSSHAVSHCVLIGRWSVYIIILLEEKSSLYHP